MAADKAEIFRNGRYEDTITCSLRDLRDDEGEARELIASWAQSNRWDRGLWRDFSIRKDGQEVRYAA